MAYRQPSVAYSEDYLQENLLGGGETYYSTPRPTSSTADLYEPPPQRGAGRDPGSGEFGSNRLVIAIDYGTTFTGVAFATPRSDKASLEDVRIMNNWGVNMGNHWKIPSVISYSPASSKGEQQWGASLSPDAVTMVNTKLELDVQENKVDELELIMQVLDGTSNLDFENVKKSRGYPDYTWKEPEEIVTDYLTEIFQHVNNTFKDLGDHFRAQVPVDIVITTPVRWSYRAKNSTLRAVKAAGFNEHTYPNLSDIIMVTEPEAAALYTARYLKADRRKEFLKLGECFILCDAGGGTVDVVSYRVKQLEPTLELEEMTIATSEKCGSAYIDLNFKKWLKRVITKSNYDKLDPRSAGQQISAHTTEGRHMREIMKKFVAYKKTFPKDGQLMKLDLPTLEKVQIAGKVTDGELAMTNTEMKSFFDPCVDKVVELIQGQIQQVERKNYRVRNVFLVGGFGESPFLQEELNRSLKMRNITMRRPDTDKAWTAVVRGAVMYGIEKAHHQNVTLTSTCSKNYGIALDEVYSYKYDRRDWYTDTVTDKIMAQKQLTWFIRRGDLLLSDLKNETKKEFMLSFQETDDLKFKFPIYEYRGGDDDDDDALPDRFETGQHELIEKAVLNVDLSNIPLIEFDQFENPKTRRPYYEAYLTCKILLSGSSIEVEIHWNRTRLCSTRIDDAETASLGSQF